jgi:hypothetical protein
MAHRFSHRPGGNGSGSGVRSQRKRGSTDGFRQIPAHGAPQIARSGARQRDVAHRVVRSGRSVPPATPTRETKLKRRYESYKHVDADLYAYVILYLCSRWYLEPQVITRRILQVLFHSQVALCGENRRMA